MKKTIYFPSFGTTCGFANSVFQYLFVSHISRIFEVDVILGSLNQNELPSAALFPVELFGIDNYGKIVVPDSRYDEFSMNRMDGFDEDLARIENFLAHPSLQTLEVSGYFQYHTSLMNSCGLRETFEKTFTPQSEGTVVNKFQQTLIGNQDSLLQFFKDKTLIVCHIRLGDYKVWEIHDDGGIFYTNDLPSLVDTIKDFINFNFIRNAEIYIASDSAEECLPIFKKNGLNPLTSKSFFPEIDLDSGTALMLDLSAISIANVFYASNSSFSIFGSLLNQQSAQFFRPSPVDKSMVGFLPWNTQILYKQSSSYPCSL